MSRPPWNYIINQEWPDCTLVTYTDEKGLTTRTYISDLILVSDGKQTVTGHCIDGIFYSVLEHEKIIRWCRVPGWMKEKIKGGKIYGQRKR